MFTVEDQLFANDARRSSFDDLLFEICEELQISQTKYELAEQRYKTIGDMLCAEGSPFASEDPKIYPQGSMRLGTTVHPVDGPFDLDFVCQLSCSYRPEKPMEILDRLHKFFKDSDRYKGMVDRKNRCVRITYADDFYMDILPACRDSAACPTCVQVPDRELKGWKASNPIGFAEWFQKKSLYRMYKVAAARDAVEPLPGLEATEEKEILQLVVQLLKRWRDLFYSESEYPPISVVLTTLAADLYRGEESTSEALLNILDGIVGKLNQARAHGKRISVVNPTHTEEDFSERWKDRTTAYIEFDRGMRELATEWRRVCTEEPNPKKAFGRLFGAVVPVVIEKQARRTQTLREAQQLGVKSSGIITSVGSAVARMRPNTNFGNGSKA